MALDNDNYTHLEEVLGIVKHDPCKDANPATNRQAGVALRVVDRLRLLMKGKSRQDEIDRCVGAFKALLESPPGTLRNDRIEDMTLLELCRMSIEMDVLSHR